MEIKIKRRINSSEIKMTSFSMEQQQECQLSSQWYDTFMMLKESKFQLGIPYLATIFIKNIQNKGMFQ